VNLRAREPDRTHRPDAWAPLVQRMATRDEAALAALYDASSAQVYGLAVRILADAAAAEEIALDTFHQAWQRAGQFDVRRGNARSWLLTIARNRAIDRLRSQAQDARRETPLEEVNVHPLDPRPDPQAAAIAVDRGATVRRALASLGGDQREVIELAFFQGLSHGQIAQRLSQPLGTVKTRIRLGIRHLAAALLPETHA
jgi:RNA polymerase sigma-70 factor (ECF subfamily)